MLNKNRKERMGARKDFEEVRNHLFFVSIDWEKLLRREIKPPFVPKVRCETDTVNISKEFIEIEPNQGKILMSLKYFFSFLSFTKHFC